MQALNVVIASLLGQVEDTAAPMEAASAAGIESVWDFVVKGGPMMIPIVIASLIALTVMIERLVSLRRSKIIPPEFLQGLKNVMDDEKKERRAAVDYCRENGSPVAAVFEAGIRRLGYSVELVEKHVQEAGERVVLHLRKYLRALSVIASIAPLLGLLGTIFGMIRAFQTVAGSGEALGRTELLAEGIYEALITTAAGLLIAIPVLIGYHWLSAKIERLVADIDAMAVEFIDEYAHAAAPSLPPGVASAAGGNGRQDDSVEPTRKTEKATDTAAV
jgi:biopolymer transport protein ExbB